MGIYQSVNSSFPGDWGRYKLNKQSGTRNSTNGAPKGMSKIFPIASYITKS